MTDITQTHLEAAILDQHVAGAMSGMDYAFFPVITIDGAYALGVAVANERGYNAVAGKTFKTHAEAATWAESLNEHIGLTLNEAFAIVASTMGGRRWTRRDKPFEPA